MKTWTNGQADGGVRKNDTWAEHHEQALKEKYMLIIVTLLTGKSDKSWMNYNMLIYPDRK